MARQPLYSRLSLHEQSSLLRRVVERSKRADGGLAPVVVFDLDGTLVDNRPRTVAILHEFAAHVAPQDQALANRLKRAEASTLEYLLRDTLESLGLDGTPFAEEIESFWRARFFSNDYVAHDVEVHGALAFARACYEAGATLVYFTGRDLPGMGRGTFESLRELGFPIGVAGTELVLKPDAAMPDETFKRQFGPTLARAGQVVAAFDNEPGNCNNIYAQYPDADTVLLDTQHLPGAPALVASVKVVADFRMP